MGESLNQLLTKLREGRNLMGTYHRRAVLGNPSVKFDQLVVKTANGGEYSTTDQTECNLFFELTASEGTNTNNGYCKEEKCNYFESFGNWQAAK